MIAEEYIQRALTALVFERYGVQPDDLDFALWFFGEADFGPAHESVVGSMIDAYERETGKTVSPAIDWRKDAE